MYGRGGPRYVDDEQECQSPHYINGGAGGDYLQGGGGVNFLYGHDQNNPETDEQRRGHPCQRLGQYHCLSAEGQRHLLTTFLNSFSTEGEDDLLGGDGNDRFVVGGCTASSRWAKAAMTSLKAVAGKADIRTHRLPGRIRERHHRHEPFQRRSGHLSRLQRQAHRRE